MLHGSGVVIFYFKKIISQESFYFYFGRIFMNYSRSISIAQGKLSFHKIWIQHILLRKAKLPPESFTLTDFKLGTGVLTCTPRYLRG
jgi:hypothetical protein